jgi:regulator of sirC expression with transglutaminase-like and TPR domain
LITTLDEKGVSELRSLLTLLDDESSTVYDAARSRLLEIGKPALQYLNPELFIGQAVLHERTAEIVETIVGAWFKDQLRQFVQKNPVIGDLEEGMLLLARRRYPFADVKLMQERLAAMSQALRSRIDTQASPVECVQTVSRYFGHELEFVGNKENYYDEQNHYLNRVMETKLGSPILLSILYMIVGHKINLPIQGLGFPGRFIVRFEYPSTPMYIDPFDRGKILSRADCEALIAHAGQPALEEYFQPMTTVKILERVFRNLILACEHKGETARAELFSQYIDIVNAKVYISE